MHPDIARVVYSDQIQRALKRHKRDGTLFTKIERQIEKILREPSFGKPLRYSLKNRRRVHVGPFVIIYELHNGELRFLDCDHHDKI